jgi:hypothetical protein
MRVFTFLGVVTLTSLLACSKNDSGPQASPQGKRVLVTPTPAAPAVAQLRSYTSASTPGPDQPLWLSTVLDLYGSQALLVRLDTAGQLLASQMIYNATYVPVAALTDGSSLALGQDGSNAFVFRLNTDGTTAWSKILTNGAGQNRTLTPGNIVPLGNDALYYGSLGNFNQRCFARIASSGAVQPYATYTFPAKAATFNRVPAFKPLPAGAGAIMLEQLDDATFLLSNLDATGHLRWWQQLNLAGLPATPQTAKFYDVAVSPTSGNLAVLIGDPIAGQGGASQLLRFSAAGALLSATTYTLSSAPHFVYFGHLAMGAQEEVAWTLESSEWVYYYAVNAQGKILASKRIANTPKNSLVSSSYGLLSIGQKGAYGFGTFAGPAPDNEPDTSINFLHISADGQAGCPTADAPALTGAAATGTRAVGLPVPTAGTLANGTASYTLYTAPLTLATSPACQ